MRIGIAAPADLSLFSPLFPNTALPPGLGSTVISRLVLALCDGGDQVVLYTLDEGVPNRRRFDAGNLTIHVGPYRRRHRMRDLMAAERRVIRDMIRDDPPDVVSAHWCYEFALGALSADRRTLITSYDWAPSILRFKPDLYRLGRLGLFLWTLAAGRHFAAPSPYIAGQISRFIRRSCPVVGQPLEERLFRATPRHWPEGEPTLVSVANGWGRLKNTRTLIQAFSTFRRSFPTAVLTFYGSDHGPGQAAEGWARSAGMAEGIVFAGLVSNAIVLEHLARSHLCVHPSLQEAFGQTVLEAMALGTPVVAGRNAGAIPWVLDDGGAGVLVDTRDPAALSDGMVSLLSDRERWEGYSAAGLASARRRFTAQAVADRYRALLRDLYDRE
ncbi:glycosyltransferase family 4 protein [Azospirillum sp. TSH100]|uniref:glycosyltransferase family 4 protein n=1 Tax=Azospirillum sp. TSH100 TaxID=652764 RepID=UPI001304903C|nr:glycosyltransferase [Azospirillum sp. TSH100]